jgi:hypothetical protein
MTYILLIITGAVLGFFIAALLCAAKKSDYEQ